MPLTLETGPALEPVSLEEARRYLRIDGTQEDALIGSLITAARLHLEAYLGRVLISQKWIMEVDAPPSSFSPSGLEIPLLPVSRIESVKKISTDGEEVVSADLYKTRLFAGAARLDLSRVSCQEQERLHIRFTAGYGASASDVPDTIREAIRRLVAYWFETRGTMEAGGGIPPSVEALLASYRSVRL